MQLNYKKALSLLFVCTYLCNSYAMEEEQSSVEQPPKRKWSEVTPDERFNLWLCSKAKATSKNSSTLSNASLALLLNSPLHNDASYHIAQELYNSIDPMFIQLLLCKRAKPETCFTHSKSPYLNRAVRLHKGNDAITLQCNRQPQCYGVYSYPRHSIKEIYTREEKIRASIYHTWHLINKSCNIFHIPKPLMVILLKDYNMITAHEDKTVRSWMVGDQSIQDKETLSSELSLEEVLMLWHMQRTRDPLDRECYDLAPPYLQEAEEREQRARSLPRKLRELLEKKRETS